MLRHPDAVSPVADLERPRFLNVIPDEGLDAKRVLLCTGKIGHELRIERQKRKMAGPAIVLLEQMYPFPETELTEFWAATRTRRSSSGCRKSRPTWVLSRS